MLASTSRNVLKRVSKRTHFSTTESSLNILRCQRFASVAAASPSQGSSRSKPWSFTPDNAFQGTTRKNAIARFQNEITRHSEAGRLIECLKTCAAMKKENVKPDLLIYNALLSSIADQGMSMEAWGILDDMKSMGITPDHQTFHHLIHASRYSHPQAMWNILRIMQEADLSPDERTFGLIIKRFTTSGNLEPAIQYMHDMGSQGLSPTLATMEDIIILATQQGFARLALDLADNFETSSFRRLNSETWMNCLLASAEALYAPGVQKCWRKLVQDLNFIPDEGLCQEVLHTAGRHGLSDLATDVIRVLKLLGVAWQEHHFAPLIEAFCRNGKLKEAIGTLDVMRRNGILAVAETTDPILQVLQKDLDHVDNAWNTLEELHKEDRIIDPNAINAIIEASISLGDLQRAVGAYKAFPDYGAIPNINTYNILLSGCIAARHRELGDRLLVELKEASLRPDARTYERIIYLCLSQESYEDAFFYLEEMKAQKFVPPPAVYIAIVQKCILAGDSRYTLALDEMKQCGYTVSSSLRRFITSNGRSLVQESRSDASTLQESDSDASEPWPEK
ncbi:hypothetical protein BJ138DRAFT_1173062 [Hygrophoropsis aurantiaca]|uniref:Uncharacterized protein n=1 Tax=Hygrophoropsis aurantiaca TaxID=72124 RepID=A0ACB8AAV8_9AGAM|nr:hypothetical protein BJ138DRAFT_1173062 [Hygrophoropsis aurantiaca]